MTSGERLKKNIMSLDAAIKQIMSVQGVNYNRSNRTIQKSFKGLDFVLRLDRGIKSGNDMMSSSSV